ncbi:MAG: hypothetical protein OXU36_21085 [Candidatus Poribacteria bacterium]|nr:hypothetical protein [Candidatus Poribacteria bacterium]
MRRVISFWSLILTVFIFANVAFAVKTSLWQQQHHADFEAGKPKDLSLTSNGDVMLSPKIESFTKLKETQVWALVEDSAGNLYVGTGNEGKIYKISADGDTAELYYNSPEVTIYSLAIGPDDVLYAGTGPDGLIYKITDATTPPTTILNEGDKYVWALQFDDTGNLYAATGTDGKIYKITSEGESSVLFDAEEKNIMTLLAQENGFYAGSSDNGIIYHVMNDGTAKVIYQAKEKEVRALAMDSQGNLYAAVVTSAPAEPSRGRRGANGPPTPSGPPPPGGGAPQENKSNIYKIRPDGTVVPIWNSPEPLILAIVIESDTQILVGTGDAGKLYRINLTTGDHIEVGKCSANQVIAIHQKEMEGNTRTLLATGNPGKLFTLTANYVKEGTLESTVHDAKSLSRWGKLSWEGEMGEGTAISFSTRTGNTKKPDDTWNDWSNELTTAEGSQVPNADAQYIQWRAKFTTSDTAQTPVLKKVTLASVQTNVEPRFTSIEVDDGSGGNRDQGRRPSGGLAPPSARGGDSGRSGSGNNVPTKNWTVSWKVEDANDDTLQYTLYYKGVSESNWRLLKKELSKAEYEWDITTVPDGRYTVKAVATDKLSNPVGWAKSVEKVSMPFEIDNTQPSIGEIQVTANGNGTYKVACDVMDATTSIQKAVYKIDSDEHWKAIFPEDGIFDSKQENLLLETGELPEGAHTIIIQVTDRAQNTAVSRAGF